MFYIIKTSGWSIVHKLFRLFEWGTKVKESQLCSVFIWQRFAPFSYWESVFELANHFGHDNDLLLSCSVNLSQWILSATIEILSFLIQQISESFQSKQRFTSLSYNELVLESENHFSQNSYIYSSHSWVNVWVSESFHSKLRFILISFNESMFQ